MRYDTRDVSVGQQVEACYYLINAKSNGIVAFVVIIPLIFMDQS